MYETLLKKIQPSVKKYSEVIANVLEVDVEIVDSNLNRVCGTGIYSEVNIKCEGKAYLEVIKTGKQNIVNTPKEDKICEGCLFKDKCKETMEIATPIFYDEKIVGVIGLVCFTEEQRIYLSSKVEVHLEFLNQIADLIKSKISEELQRKEHEKSILLLNQVINNIENGVLIINENDSVSEFNNSAFKQLKLSTDIENNAINIKNLDDYFGGQQVFEIDANGRKYSVIGKKIRGDGSLGENKEIFIFNMVKKIKEEAYKLTAATSIIDTNNIIGKSVKMIELKEKIKRISSSKSTVLITGESGTGKEVIARAIHGEGDRKKTPFIAINCGAIPDSLLESELFGYVKGAFSGADPNGRVGKFELANGGVILLDEIGDMPIHLQVKLLRVLQERKFVRIGSNKLIDLDIRVIAATNKDLKELIEENKFREDLYYRLNVIPIEIPPLREREGDIELLLGKLIKKYNRLFGQYVHTITDEANKKLLEYNWPGNVRELENTVEFIINVAGSDGVITLETLPEAILKNNNEEEENIEEIIPLRVIEETYIRKALEKYGTDTKGKELAAKKLGMGIATLYRRIDNMKKVGTVNE